MKTWKIITITTIAAVIAAIVLVSSVSAMMSPGSYNPFSGIGSMMGRYGGGMMGSYGYNYAPQGTSPTTPYNGNGGCPGRGYGTTPYTTSATPIDITAATTIAKNYVASTGNPDLTVKQLEEYQANYYVQVNEKSTGNGAFELLINKYTGVVNPEMGPNMMWNTKYGMMRGGGMMGGLFGTQTGPLTVTPTQATANAQQFLTANIPGTTTGDVTTFPGYYTIEIVNGTTPYGMLSVNGYSGQIWFHNWHGAFIQETSIS